MDDAERWARELFEVEWDALPDGTHAYTRALEASMRALTKLLRATPPAVSELPGNSGWLPIESAPKDHTVILFYAQEYGLPGPGICRWAGELYGWWAFGERGGMQCFPTHWMPLPTAPQPREEADHAQR